MKNCNRWEEKGEQQDETYERVGRIVIGQDGEEEIEAKEVKREENKKAESRYNVLQCFLVVIGRFHLCTKILNIWL